MKFSDFVYVRPDMEVLKSSFETQLKSLEAAEAVEAQEKAINEIIKLRSEYESMSDIAAILYTLDTANESYEREKDFFNENTPVYKKYISSYYELLSKSHFRSQLEKKFGKQLFNIAELTVKAFSPEIIEDLKEENKLTSEYVKLISSVKIMFEGEERNLSGMYPFQLSKDRDMRYRAFKARYGYMEGIRPQLDEIYDRLVKVRTRIAKKLGYKNFIEVGYARMLRSDYNADSAKAFRDQVHKYIVPIASKLRERQRIRLKLDKLMIYDDYVTFDTGNPTPKGTYKDIIASAKKMYSELSRETKEFFDFMIENELMDLLNKPSKAPGGYCAYISKYQSPFIFSNFNGTSDDIIVLTHEAGHAFQAYCSKNNITPEYYSPTLEACEIHSMSMEFLTWPWMNLFFQEDTDKFKFDHLAHAITFIPYAATVDEFQHFVYENPDVTPEERREEWRRLEKKYLPHRDHGDIDYLEHGGFWHQQGHIFEDPFYYIDYALAQICALQYWQLYNKDKEKAWDSYINLCKLGGSKSFVELVKAAGLISPFDGNCVKSVVEDINSWLDKVDDSKL